MSTDKFDDPEEQASGGITTTTCEILNNNDEIQNPNENKLLNMPDLLQEVHELTKLVEIKTIKLLASTSLPNTTNNQSNLNIRNKLDTYILPRSKSGGLPPMRSNGKEFYNLSTLKSKNNLQHQHKSKDTVKTLDSAPGPVSIPSSIQNSDETLSTQSSNQISQETCVKYSENAILSNQLSLSYDVSELEPVSLYSFRIANTLDSRNHFEIQMKPTSTTSQPISMCSIGSVVCRICHNAEEPERLISPCLCKGTLAYVHKNCLEHWLRTSGMVSCELCHYRFKVRASLRYTLVQSLRMWYSHPNNRGLLQADFLVCSLLTVVSFGLVGISMMALQHFVLQGRRYGVSRFWTQICILMFLSIISFVYSINMFLILKSQLVPWYTWWQSAKDVTLILENRKSDIALTRLKEKQKQSEEVELESMILSGRQSMPPPTPPLVATPTPPINTNDSASHVSRRNNEVFVTTV